MAEVESGDSGRQTTKPHQNGDPAVVTADECIFKDSALKDLKITCLCERFTYKTTISTAILPLPTKWCHCYGCRHLTGGLNQGCCQWPTSMTKQECYEVLFKGLTKFNFSPDWVDIWFCPTCGTWLFWRGQKETSPVIIPSALLNDAADVVQLTNHIMVRNTRDGGIADFIPIVNNRPIPRWARFVINNPKDFSDLLPLGWRLQDARSLSISGFATDTSSLSTSQNVKVTESLSQLHPQPYQQQPEQVEYLEAKCLCGGVNFYLTRPDSPAFSVPTRNHSSDTSAEKGKADGSTPHHHDHKDSDEWFEKTSNKYLSVICVCRSCRLSTSTDAVPVAFVPTCNIFLPPSSPDGALRPYRPNFGTLKWYRSSSSVRRAHCSTCGAYIMVALDWERLPLSSSDGTKSTESDADLIDENSINYVVHIPVGLFCAQEGARAESWLVWRTWRIANVDDGMKPEEQGISGGRNDHIVEALKEGMRKWGEASYLKKSYLPSKSELFGIKEENEDKEKTAKNDSDDQGKSETTQPSIHLTQAEDQEEVPAWWGDETWSALDDRMRAWAKEMALKQHSQKPTSNGLPKSNTNGLDHAVKSLDLNADEEEKKESLQDKVLGNVSDKMKKLTV